MSEYDRNSSKKWSDADEGKLKKLIKENTPTRVICLELGRTPNAIYAKARELDVSLRKNAKAGKVKKLTGRVIIHHGCGRIRGIKARMIRRRYPKRARVLLIRDTVRPPR